jgi:hypothetical protein
LLNPTLAQLLNSINDKNHRANPMPDGIRSRIVKPDPPAWQPFEWMRLCADGRDGAQI